jgi:predicted extracellular nuclease
MTISNHRSFGTKTFLNAAREDNLAFWSHSTPVAGAPDSMIGLRLRGVEQAPSRADPGHVGLIVPEAAPADIDGFTAAAFAAGNIVVYRVGTGTALTSAATAVFLDEYTPSGTFVQSIQMPTADSGAQQTLTASGTATSEGLLTLSADGHYLLVTGYDSAPGTAGVAGGAALRVVGRVGADGSVDTSTTLGTFLSGNNIRSATSSNGTDIWVAGANGVAYTTFGSTANATVLASQNSRDLGIFGGQLYESSGSGSFRIASIGSGLPTSGTQTLTALPGIPISTTNSTPVNSPYGFFLADLTGAVAGVDTLYIADEQVGILKYSLVSGTWTLNGTVGTTTDDYRGLTASVSGGTVTLFATRDNGGGADTIVSLVDTAGYNAAFSSTTVTTIVTAGSNLAFRGIAFAPTPLVAPATISIQATSIVQAEGNSGATAYTFTLTRSSGSADATVAYAITGMAGIDATDFVGGVLPSGTATFSGSNLTTTITVNVQGDTVSESDETFTVTLSGPSSGYTLGAQSTQTGTITNDDTLPSQTVEFATGSVSVIRPEVDSGSVTYIFTVTRSGGTTGAVTVSGTLTPGAGVDAADFGGTLPTGFTANIADGATTGTFSITVSGDNDIELDEIFSLAITGAVNGGGAPMIVGAANAATGTILNDDAGQTIGGITVYDAASSTLEGDATPPANTDDVVLVRLGQFATSGGAGGAESVAFDTLNHRLYVTNAAQDRVDVAQLNADGTTTTLASLDLSGAANIGTINSVAVKNGIVAIAYDNVTAGQPGFVALYSSSTGALLNTLQVGVVPDQLTFTPDGLRLLVANEAEAVSTGNNPNGSISVISLAGGAAGATVTNTIDFTAFNNFETELAARGLALFGGQSAAADIEPEYITVSPDGLRAYVTLQEVNAVAVIDLSSPGGTLLALQPLGGVDHNLAGNAFDPNDTNGISLGNWDVISLLQPDAIASFQVNGITYFITANEGDARVGSGLEGVDVVRVNSAGYTVDPTAYNPAIEGNSQLGRLNVLTNVGDTDFDGDFDQIYNIGGRGVTIFRQNADGTIDKVRETGGEFEAIIARDFAALFNNNQATGTVDSRSDDKGPEPEGVSVGQVGDRLYAFVTLERVGGVMVYDITDPVNATFVTYRPATGATFGPETSTFIGAAGSPTGGALLLTADEITGATTIYRVVRQTEGADIIEGSSAADTFGARGGNDTITGFGGNDVIDGGADSDTVNFSGNRADYSVIDNGGGVYTIADTRAGTPDGTDTISNVEFFHFADGTVAAADLIDTGSVGTVSIADASIVEGNAGTSVLMLTVTRSGGGAAFNVDFATADGGDPTHASATAGSDYVANSGTLIFALGQTTATVSITINGDTTVELSEELTVTLSNPTNGATISDGTAIATITNDDILNLGPANAWINEFHYDNSGTDAGEFIEIAGAAGTDLSQYSIVRYNGSNAPGAAVVYTSPAQTTVLTGTIADQGGTGFGTFVVNFAQDGLQNGASDGFALVRTVNSVATVVEFWSYEGVITASGGAANGMTSVDVGVAETGSASGTSISRTSGPPGATWVLDADDTPGAFNHNQVLPQGGTAAPAVAVSDVSVNEAAGTMTFTVTRTNAVAGAFSIAYATADGTASAGSDYTATSGTLNFADNQVSATVTVAISNDGTPELDETLFLNLSNPTNGATIGDAQATGTIINDDGTPIQVSINDVSIVEGNSGTSILTFTVTRSGDSGAFDVSFATANDSATAPSDYIANSGTLSFGVGQNTQTISITVNGDLSPEATEQFFVNLTNPTNNAVLLDGQGVGTIINDEGSFIHDIQGTAYFSPLLAGEGISAFNVASAGLVTVSAIVTAVDNDGPRQGFYIQEEITDWDGNRFTSEGIFVMTRNDAGVGAVVSGVTAGDLVTVTAHVMEYKGFATNMPITALVNASSIVVQSHGNTLPTFVLDASQHIPSSIMTSVTPDYTDSSDGAGDTFDASLYGLSYWETVEGMLVTVPDMVVADGFVGTSGGRPFLQAYSAVHADASQINSRGGYTIAGDPPNSPPDTPNPEDGTTNGGRVLHDGDVNPDIIELDWTGWADAPPAGLSTGASMGDQLGDVTGIIDFDFTDRKLFVTDMEPGGFVNGTVSQETTTFGSDNRSLTVAAFNVENLDPGDGAARFTALANAIKNNLHMPDILSIEEMQDNNGATDDGTTDASTTWQMLVDALNLATGAHYQWVDQEPGNKTEGGEPGGNIRVGFLYNTDRVQLGDLAANATLSDRRHYTDRIGDGVRDAGDLIAFSDNMLGSEINTTDWTTTRRSLLGEFTFNGNTVYVTANHWPAKGGSGDFWQFNQNIGTGDPDNSDWAQRNQVAQDVYSMLNLIQSGNPHAGIVSGGDYNDFYFYRPLEVVTGYVLPDGSVRSGGARFDNLTLTLPEAERYTYTFDGRSQAIDHIIVNDLLSDVASYDVVHLNTGFNPTGSPALSDHDPGLASFDFRSFAEVLTGTASADLIRGFGGNDVINGANGNDQLDGGTGDDTLNGGFGDDTYFLDSGADQVNEAAGQGFDAVYTNVSYTLAAGTEVEWLSTASTAGIAALTLVGNGFGQYLIGNDGLNLLVGGGGADVMVGYNGNDTYYVDNAGDYVAEASGQGFDAVYATTSYALAAGQEVEWLSTAVNGDSIALNLSGNESGQTLIGNAGTNVLNGLGGADAMVGLAGNDTYAVDHAGDVVVEAAGQGFDAVYTSVSYTLAAGVEVEWLSTASSTATAAINLTGNQVSQYLVGNDGANVLDGKGGADVLIGLGGADTFSFTAALGNFATISDFVHGTDKIALDDAVFTAIGGLGALNANAFVTGTGAADGSDRIIYNSATGQLYYDADGSGNNSGAVLFATLQGAPTLSASDFMVI